MLWFKALHLIFMVTWFAGLFYLSRLFVYHAMSSDQISIDRFKVMERKLFFGIMTPGGILTIIFGTATLYTGHWLDTALPFWLQVKLALLIVLIVYHVHCGKLLFDFKHDRNKHTHVYYRWHNEFPVLILIGVVLLAVLRPV